MAAHTLPAYPDKMKFYSFCTYILKILQQVEGHFLRPGGPLLARGPQVGNHWDREFVSTEHLYNI